MEQPTTPTTAPGPVVPPSAPRVSEEAPAAETRPTYEHVTVPWWHRVLEVLAITGVVVILAMMAWEAVLFVQTWTEFAWIAAVAVVSFVGADFACGMVHWGADRIGTERTPIVGPGFIAPFREHHHDEKAMTRHSFVEVNGNNCLVCLPVVALVWYLYPAEHGMLQLPFLFLSALVFFVACTNQIHFWAHLDEPPRPVAWLQRIGLILHPKHHAVHHVYPHTRYYCITTGWMNSFLERINFFHGVETVLVKIFPGIIPEYEPRSKSE
jgi:ubiquitin-conjugating enzyme E2 variant